MVRALRATLNIFISFTLALMTPAPVWAARAPQLSNQEAAQLRYDMQLAYWAQLDHQMPEVAALGLSEEIKPLWKVSGDNPLLDSDPFFMRSQSWSEVVASTCDKDLCFSKDKNGVTLGLAGQKRALTIQQSFTPILETQDHLFLSADDDTLFRQKVGGEAQPGEGVFFIAKKDLLFAGEKANPVPVFYFPMPDEGWTGQNPGAFEFDIVDQVVLTNASGFALALDKRDIALMEQMGRQNLVLAETFAFLDGEAQTHGVTLPKPASTLLFGILPSGQTTRAAEARQLGKKVGSLARAVLPEAHADENENPMRTKILEQVKARAAQLEEIEKAKAPEPASGQDQSYLKKWLIVGGLYGLTTAAAVGAYEPIDFSNMITADMPERITTVAQLLGGVALASVAMKYTIHKAHFDKLYPKSERDSLLTKLNQEHKGLMSELAHGLYFSLAALPQGIRHALEFLKDHFIPANKSVSRLWEATMGFQMKQNSHLAMNYKTQYLGWLFGFADSVMVGVYLLIFGPYIINHLGLDINFGHATAAFASAEVLRNFLAYLQSGAHGYSAEVKFIHLKSAENEARKQMQAAGLNPDAARNQQELLKLTEAELARRYKTVGLPGQDEFLYDPITFLESATKRAGFWSAEAVTQSPNTNFVLANRHWGLVQPALKKALQTARKAYKQSPSDVGLQTIKTLEWALKDRSVTKRTAKKLWGLAANSGEARDGLQDSVAESLGDYLTGQSGAPNVWGANVAYVKGVYKYLVTDSAQEVRDIRQVLFLMSTTGSASEVMKHMPKSWLQHAGSEEAAAISAELFHRAFFGFYEHDSDLITPSDDLEAQYGDHARELLAHFETKEEVLKDPFVRQVRYWELLCRLKKKDESRREIFDHRPLQLTGKAKRQWEIVRSRALGQWWRVRKDESSSEAWQQLAENYSEVTGSEVKDPQAWAKSYRFRLLVARQFAKEVGLETDDVEQSEFVRKVVVDAASRTDAELATRRERVLASRLKTSELEFHEAQIFTRHFIDSYVSLSVHSDEHLKHDSPEYPGRFQKIRKAIVGKPGSRYITGVLRGVEAMFRNEETSYQAGWSSFLERNVPLVPDMVYNFIRNLRITPYFLSISYLISWYVWQIHTPYALWAFTLLIAFMNPTLVEVNNRLQKNYGFKPMGDVPSKLIYSWFHSFLTNPELILVQGYSQPIVDSFDRHVVQPVKSIPGKCVDLLTGK